MQLTYLFIFLSLSTMAAPLSIQEEWKSISDPLIMSKSFETRLYMLPMTAQISTGHFFWSGDYWPVNKGSINHRWNASRNFTLPSPTLAQARSMTQQELAQLSPTEKFDLLNGNYHYPLKKEVEKITDYRALSWEGMCHGWAPASMNHKEPTPKTFVNPDGLSIPFGSSDIKALLSYYYAYPYQVPNTHQLGRRCYEARTNTNEDCQQDLNAGAFHIVLANRVGLDQVGLIADLNRYKEVWNHPISGYRSIVTGEGRSGRSSAPGTVRTTHIETTIFYTDGTDNSWGTIMETNKQKVKKMNLSYTLEIDINGQIIGGEWRSIQRPDFLWIKERSQNFSGNFQLLAELLND